MKHVLVSAQFCVRLRPLPSPPHIRLAIHLLRINMKYSIRFDDFKRKSTSLLLLFLFSKLIYRIYRPPFSLIFSLSDIIIKQM